MIQEQLIKVQVLEGKYSGQVLLARNSITGSAGVDIVVDKGEQVIVYISEQLAAEGQKAEIAEIYVVEKVRTGAPKILLGFFMGLLILIGGIQ